MTEVAVSLQKQQLEAHFLRKLLEQGIRQACGFRTEDQHVIFRVPYIGIEYSRFCRESEDASPGEVSATRVPVLVQFQFGNFMVVETGAPKLPVVDGETERLDQMQTCAGIRREPDHVAGVRRDLGLHEDDLKHRAGRSAQRPS